VTISLWVRVMAGTPLQRQLRLPAAVIFPFILKPDSFSQAYKTKQWKVHWPCNVSTLNKSRQKKNIHNIWGLSCIFINFQAKGPWIVLQAKGHWIVLQAKECFIFLFIFWDVYFALQAWNTTCLTNISVSLIQFRHILLSNSVYIVNLGESINFFC
jgi:hypothetical protein